MGELDYLILKVEIAVVSVDADHMSEARRAQRRIRKGRRLQLAVFKRQVIPGPLNILRFPRATEERVQSRPLLPGEPVGRGMRACTN